MSMLAYFALNAQIVHENNFNTSVNWDAAYHFNYRENFSHHDSGGYENSGYIRIKVSKDQHYGGSLRYVFADNGISDPREVYAQYRVLYESSMGEYTGKSPGFDGTRGVCGWGNCVSDGTNGWSARGSISPNTSSLVPNKYYVYHKDMDLSNGKTWGDSWKWSGTGAEMEHNTWYRVTQYIKVNHPDSSNGILRAWVDGVKVFEKTNIRFTTTTSNNFDKLYAYWFNYYHGGTAVSPQDAYVRIDDFVLSSSFIGEEAPRIDISSPTNGDSFISGDTIEVLTSVVGEYNVLNIEVDGIFYDSDSAAPYSFSIPDLPDGSHTLYVYGELKDSSIIKGPTVAIYMGAEEGVYIETFEKMTLEGWGKETYVGDNGFEWNVTAKGTKGYLNPSKCIYMVSYDKNGDLGVKSGVIPGGISSFTVTCRDLWGVGAERTLELLINDIVVGTSKHTGEEIYTFTVENINKPGDITIAIKNSTPVIDTENNSVAIDNITWVGYNGAANSKPEINDQTFSVLENSANNTLVGKVVASDPDTNQTLSYSILSGNTDNVFEINKANGELIVSDSTLLDYETTPQYNLIVEVVDSDLFPERNSATITINVEDVYEPTGINDNFSESFNIFPNPFSSTLTIQIFNNDFRQLKLLDMSGRELINNDIRQASELFICPSFSLAPPGMYILQLISENEVKTLRVLRK